MSSTISRFNHSSWFSLLEPQDPKSTEPTTSEPPTREGDKIYDCQKPLNLFEWLDDSGKKTGLDTESNPLFHEYLCIEQEGEPIECGGQDKGRLKGFLLFEGKPSHDVFSKAHCEEISFSERNECVAECVASTITSQERPDYSIDKRATDCQEFVKETLASCLIKCPEEK